MPATAAKPRSRRLATLALVALPWLALTSGAALAEPKVLAIVNGETITDEDAALAIEDLQAQYPNLPVERQQSVAVDFLVEVKLVAQAAKRAKIEESEDFKRKLAYARERILMEGLLRKEGAKAADDAAIKAFYDSQIGQIKPVEEVRARHILVEEEDQAKAIVTRLKGGEDFAKVAAETSKDPGSGKDGGDLGFFTKDRMVPEFAEAAFAMQPGELSAPVKSQFGWHIIRVEERRARPLPTLDEVKDRLATALSNKAQTDYIANLRKEAKIELKLPNAEPPK